MGEASGQKVSPVFFVIAPENFAHTGVRWDGFDHSMVIGTWKLVIFAVFSPNSIKINALRVILPVYSAAKLTYFAIESTYFATELTNFVVELTYSAIELTYPVMQEAYPATEEAYSVMEEAYPAIELAYFVVELTNLVME